MGRIVSFIIVVIIIVAKYFIFKHLDEKKMVEEIEASKTKWSDEYKVSYLSNCKGADTAPENAARMALFCECIMEKTQAAGPFATVYDPDKQSADQYVAEVTQLEEAYLNSAVGTKNVEDCTAQAAAQ